MSPNDIITLIVSLSAIAVSIAAFIFSIYQFSKTRKANFYNLVYENMRPISEFIYDALLCKDKAKFVDCSTINQAEKTLVANFDALYSYGVGENLPFLRQFSTITIKEEKPNKLLNALCFEHLLLLAENQYMEYRKIKEGKELEQCDYSILQSYIDFFRRLLTIQSKYTVSVLYKTKRHICKSNLKSYYLVLIDCYEETYKYYLFDSIEQYDKGHDKKWYEIYMNLRWEIIDDDKRQNKFKN